MPDSLRLFSVRGLPAILFVGVAAFGGWSLLLPVVPLALSMAGESDAIAGASTAVFMAATVATQFATPKALRSWGYRPVFAAGCTLLGAPAFAFLLSVDAVPVLAASAVRGTGFGLITVAGVALIAEVAPAELLGRASAAFGIAIAAVQIVCLPAGLALVHWFSTEPVFVLGAVVPLIALIGVGRLPAVRPVVRASDEPKLRFPLVLLLGPCLAMIAVAGAFGGFSSLVPIATDELANAATLALAVHSAATVVGRYAGGALSDRVGPGAMLIPSLAISALGLVLVAFSLRDHVSVPLLTIGGAVFGVGFGICQSDSLVLIFAAAGPHRRGAASAAWNAAYDSGTGIGAISLGVLATVSGYSTAFLFAAVAAALVAPIRLRS